MFNSASVTTERARKEGSAAAFHVGGESLCLECRSLRKFAFKAVFALCLIKLDSGTKQPEATDVREGDDTSFVQISLGAQHVLWWVFFLFFWRGGGVLPRFIIKKSS